MLGVVVPAHDEESHIEACLVALCAAIDCPALGGEFVLVVVVLDACSDRTGELALARGAALVEVDARNVGIARARGADFALAAGVRWLAFTDADTVVAPDWLVAQLAQSTDAVCGTIEVHDWGDYDSAVREHHARTYLDCDGHRHVHGANLGVSARAYRDAGGFLPLPSSEDVALVEALSNRGSSIAWSAAPRVRTSARRCFRAPDGFGATLARSECELAPGGAGHEGDA